MTTPGTEQAVHLVRQARALHGDVLLEHPDVHGIGVGLRRTRGTKTGEPAIVLHVACKLPLDAVPNGRRLPRTVTIVGPDGLSIEVRVDVQERSKPTPEGDRVRPAPGGVSAGDGTLGGWVWDRLTNQVVALSNAHVFGTDKGTIVTQPSWADGGREDVDMIAAVLRSGSLDACIAAPINANVISRSIAGAGDAVLAIGEGTIGMRVQKTGAQSGVTFGTIDLIDYDSGYFGSHSDLWIDGGEFDFSNQGDSGSLYVESVEPGRGPPRIIGLHWGGSGKDGVGHRIQDVFSDLSLAPLPA